MFDALPTSSRCAQRTRASDSSSKMVIMKPTITVASCGSELYLEARMVSEPEVDEGRHAGWSKQLDGEDGYGERGAAQ